MMLNYGQVLVCGLGASGEAVAELLVENGNWVTVIDERDTVDLRQTAVHMAHKNIRVVLGEREIPDQVYDVCVVSPGVPFDSPWLKEMRSRGVPLVSELEVGWKCADAPVIAVTGSNGKSTLVKWLGDAARSAGLRAVVAGNYGFPVSRAVREYPDLDLLILEVSSFQLETTHEFAPDIAVLLNLHPNHLDRHGDMRTYTALKAKIFSNANPETVCIVHEDLLEEVKTLSGGEGCWHTFGLSSGADYQYEDGVVRCHGELLMDLSGTIFANRILGQAGAAVSAVLDAREINVVHAQNAARKFEPLPHRMQHILEVDGIEFINDSKATNLSALVAAIEMTGKNVRLIAGGLVKEKDLSFVKELLVEKVLGVYLIGKASEQMASAWSEVVPCFLCETLDRAVRKAVDDANSGEAVLFSPACASFDQFGNFEERGEAFVKVVVGLVGEMAQ